MRETTSSLPATTIDKFAQLADLLHRASLLAREISRSSEQLRRPIPDDQAWFWTPEWQAGEREVDTALQQGEFEEFETVEDALAALHQQV